MFQCSFNSIGKGNFLNGILLKHILNKIVKIKHSLMFSVNTKIKIATKIIKKYVQPNLHYQGSIVSNLLYSINLIHKLNIFTISSVFTF